MPKQFVQMSDVKNGWLTPTPPLLRATPTTSALTVTASFFFDVV